MKILSLFDQAGSRRIATTKDSECHQIAWLELIHMLRIDQSGANRAGVAQLLDVMQELLFRQFKLFRDVRHDAHVGLMTNEIREIIQGITMVSQQVKHILWHVGTSLHEDISTLRHSDTTLFREQMHRLHRLGQITQATGINL